MCNSLNTTFAWVGAILVNIGFVALITWGASTLWPLGFVLCAIYTVCLYELAIWLRRQENEENITENLEQQQSSHSVDNQESVFEIVEDTEERGPRLGAGALLGKERHPCL